MTEQEVIDLMKSSKSEDEWNQNCDKVKASFDGYPLFWYRAVIQSNLAQRTAKSWGGDAEIHITVA